MLTNDEHHFIGGFLAANNNKTWLIKAKMNYRKRIQQFQGLSGKPSTPGYSSYLRSLHLIHFSPIGRSLKIVLVCIPSSEQTRGLFYSEQESTIFFLLLLDFKVSAINLFFFLCTFVPAERLALFVCGVL